MRPDPRPTLSEEGTVTFSRVSRIDRFSAKIA